MPFAQLKALFRTLRVRLVLWITVSVCLLSAVTLYVVREQFRLALSADLDLVLRAEARDVITDLVLRAEARDGLKDMTKFPSANVAERINFKANKFGFFVQVYDADRQLLWESSTIPTDLPTPVFPSGPPPNWKEPLLQKSPFDFTETGTHRVLIRKRAIEPKDPFPVDLWFRVGASKKNMLESVQKLNKVLFFAMLGIMVVTPLGAYVLAGRATRPLAKIISTTARLQPQNLHERLQIRGTGDELDQLSQTINSMLDRIASYIDRHRDFIADAAHELRSPLTAIRSSVEVTLNRPRSAEEYQGLLSDVMEECSRLANLVNRLLLLAEGDAGRLTGRDQVASLDKLVRESLDMFEPVADSHGVRLHLAKVDEAMVPGDEFYLRLVVRNLIDNAVKFTQSGGSVELSVLVNRDKRQVRLCVADTGMGISAEDLPRVFDRFYRGDKSRYRQNGHGGFGLGLSICQSIVKSLGGDIFVTSTILQGSTFTVVLPLAVEGKRSLTAASS